jgi:hypothetical protein
MFIIKGLALGAVMFFVFSLIYLWAWGMLPSTHKAVGLMAFKAVVVQNGLYWIACALTLALGCVIVAMWPVKVSP